jgi:hypothetical protein
MQTKTLFNSAMKLYNADCKSSKRMELVSEGDVNVICSVLTPHYLIICSRSDIHFLGMYVYGGIFLPPTCKINYVNMQENYVNMQENYVNMQVTNLLGESDFNMGKITCISPYLTL